MRLSTTELLYAALAYHPYSPLLFSRNVDVLPHQLSALYGDADPGHTCRSPLRHMVLGLLRSGFPTRALLADETGLGKTVIIGLYILSLMLRGLVRNAVIVVPKSVVAQWQDELLYKFGLYFEVPERAEDLVRLQRRVGEGSEMRLIVSIDLIKGKSGQELADSLPERFIDLLVIDEAHHVITPTETLRFGIAKSLAGKSKAVILSSATPFRGYYDPEIDSIQRLLGQPFLYIRRFKDQVLDIRGQPVFPRRLSYTMLIRPPIKTDVVLRELMRLISAMEVDTLLKLVLMKRAASSLWALKETISNIREAALSELESPRTDDVEGVEPDERRSSKRLDKKLVGALENLLSRIDTTTSNEPKEQVLLDLVRKLAPHHKVVVFTEYRATLLRLVEVFKKTDIGFVFIHGGMSARERRGVMTTFWSDSKTRVMLATDAAGEGVNLQVASFQINYDIPWSPLKLEQRFGRIHRYGQRQTAVLHNMALTGTIDELIVKNVVEKLDNVARLLGDWVYDYVGVAVRPEEVLGMLMKGSSGIDENVMIDRLKVLRLELHNPRCDHGKIAEEVFELRRRVFAGGLVKELNVLDAIRASRAINDLLKGGSGRRIRCPDGVGLGVYKAGDSVVAIWLVVRAGDKITDPLAGASVADKDASSYLSERVRDLASFYGFDGGDVVICENL